MTSPQTARLIFAVADAEARHAAVIAGIDSSKAKPCPRWGTLQGRIESDSLRIAQEWALQAGVPSFSIRTFDAAKHEAQRLYAYWQEIYPDLVKD